MDYSLETGYGPKAGLDQVISGRVFMVAASTVANYNYLASMFPVDEQGVVRLHATLAAARAAATASAGDMILVAEGHTESSTSAGGITLSTAGVEYKGLGVGDSRPTLTIASTDNTGSILISGNNVKFTNFVIVCNDDAATNLVNVTGNNCYIDIETHDTSAAIEAATVVRLDTADNCYLKLKHNGFIAGNAMVSAVRLDDCDNVRIDVDFYGVVTTAVVEMVDVASTNVFVNGKFYVSGTTDLSKNVVDTITGSIWAVDGFDVAAGQPFNGGSGNAVAVGDLSAIASDLATVKGNVGGTDSATNVLGADDVDNQFASTNVVSNRDGSILERLEHLAALLSQGQDLIVVKTFTSSDIPNNTQTGGALTGAASGTLVLKEIILQTDATGVAGPTNIEISTDNAKGLTGAGAPNVTTAVAGLGANKTVNLVNAASEVLPLYLESGKKLYIHGDDLGGAGAGTVDVIMIFGRVSADATIAAA